MGQLPGPTDDLRMHGTGVANFFFVCRRGAIRRLGSNALHGDPQAANPVAFLQFRERRDLLRLAGKSFGTALRTEVIRFPRVSTLPAAFSGSTIIPQTDLCAWAGPFIIGS